MAALNQTPGADRIQIAFFGRRNAGKSSLVNAVTGQEMSIVSEVKGTTTDPVTKSMELLPLGPVVIIDTPGLDDEGELGALRVQGGYRCPCGRYHQRAYRNGRGTDHPFSEEKGSLSDRI